MKNTIVLSMLHEPADRNSATRLFRRERVISWTISRISRAKHAGEVAVLCWDDQRESLNDLAARIISRGRRTSLQPLDNVTAARRWSDGWRSGVLQTCDFDLGFDAESLLAMESDNYVLIDPAAGLIDPALIDEMIQRADSRLDLELIFTSAAPGFGATIFRRGLVERLAKARTHPGRLLHYLPTVSGADPIATDAHVPGAVSVMRTTRQFKLNSDRQISRLTSALQPLNGQLIGSSAAEIVSRSTSSVDDTMPREIKLEVTTKRTSNPIFLPRFEREDIDAKTASAIFTEIAACDDIRLTLGGIGDPLNHPHLSEIISLAKDRGISAICVETDLLSDPTPLANPAIDIVAFHLPATTPATYQKIMGVDACTKVLLNLKQLLGLRGNSATPILVPIFTKCRDNLAEMEAWYDYWINHLGTAVIDGPSDFAGQFVDVGVADMTPPRRVACNRIGSRMAILCDGSIVACEQDFAGRNVLGRIGSDSIRAVWQQRFAQLREAHRNQSWNAHSLCGSCKEWHRP